MFRVDVSKKTRKSGLKMPKHYQERIEELLVALEDEPIPAKLYDIEKMEGIEHTYRVRIGDVRITYTVFWGAHEVEVLQIKWRGKAYR